MIIKVIAVSALLFCFVAKSEVDCDRHKVYCQIKKHVPRLTGKEGMELSNIIHKQCLIRKIPCQIFVAILIQESRLHVEAKNCRNAMIKKNGIYVETRVCFDFGISQINFKTAKAFEFEIEKLLTDVEYSVAAGAEILNDFRIRYAKEEENWWSRYNSSTPVHRKVYEELVKRWF